MPFLGLISWLGTDRRVQIIRGGWYCRDILHRICVRDVGRGWWGWWVYSCLVIVAVGDGRDDDDDDDLMPL